MSIVALVVNTLAIPAGLFMLAYSNHAVLGALVISVVIGMLFAILCDGMTLSSAARLRKAMEEKKEIQQSFAQIPPKERTSAIRAMLREQEEALVPRLVLNGIFIGFFGLTSAAAGDIFWHACMVGMPQWQAWITSTLAACSVTGVMICTEIFRQDNAALIQESIQDANYTAIAAQQDANDAATKIMSKRYETKIKEIAEDGEAVDAAIEGYAETVYDKLLLGGQGRLQQRLRQERESREYVEQQEAERTQVQLKLIKGGASVDSQPRLTNFERVRQFMINNPGCINKDIEAALPDIPAKSLRTMASRVRQERAVN
jgi:hypothetical protein